MNALAWFFVAWFGVAAMAAVFLVFFLPKFKAWVHNQDGPDEHRSHSV